MIDLTFNDENKWQRLNTLNRIQFIDCCISHLQLHLCVDRIGAFESLHLLYAWQYVRCGKY